jgi:hypothetical protein
LHLIFQHLEEDGCTQAIPILVLNRILAMMLCSRTNIVLLRSNKKLTPGRQVKVSDHKSADHHPNLVLGAKN